LEGNRYGMTREVEIEGLPKSMDEALQYDETAKDEQRGWAVVQVVPQAGSITDKEIAKTSGRFAAIPVSG